MIVIPGLRIILAKLHATCGNKMERMTLHERVINETVTIMNAVFSKLEVSLIIKCIRRSDIIWQQRREA